MLRIATIFLFPVIIAFLVGLAFAQYYLSKKENKRLGLILPIIFLCISIVLSIPNFYNAFAVSFSLGAFLSSLLVLLVYNIPTIIFSIIYLMLRKRVRENSLLNKMNVQDLQ